MRRINYKNKHPWMRFLANGGLIQTQPSFQFQGLNSNTPQPQMSGLSTKEVTPLSGQGGNVIGGATQIAGAVGSIIGTAVSNSQLADTSALSDTIEGRKNYQVGANDLDSLMNEWGQFTPLDHVTWKQMQGGNRTAQDVTGALSSTASGVGAGASVGGPVGAIVGGVIGLGSSIFGSASRKRKAKRRARKLNRQIDEANDWGLSSLNTRADAIETQQGWNALANYSAFGGPLGGDAISYELAQDALNNQRISAMSKLKMTSLPNSFSNPEMFNAFAKGGGIHIKKKNRGKFTEYCGGKVTSACIARGKKSKSAAVRKRATFAQNARRWKHAFGGWLNTQGGDYTNGVSFIDEGGTHEQNPFDGVQMGVDEQGVPNLVEEGEVVYNDYVFSNRIKVPKKLKEKYKFNGDTFADVAKYVQTESEERPNDPISMNTLESGMQRLAEAQEEIKAKKELRESNQFAMGGPKGMYPYDDEDAIATGSKLLGNPFEFTGGYAAPEIAAEDAVSTGPSSNRRPSWMRYAPIAGAGIASIADIFSKPDYSGPNDILDSVSGLNQVDFNPLGNYLTYNPLDRNYYQNMLNAQTAATRRAIREGSGGNRAQYIAGALAADYNYGNNLGALARQAEEYNQAQRERVEAFNRGTNQFNSEGALKAQMANQKNDELRFRGVTTAAQMRQAIKDQAKAQRSANLSNFLQGLGDLGWENEQANWLDRLAESGVLKMNTRGEYTGGKKAKGGKIRKKRRTTYA